MQNNSIGYSNQYGVDRFIKFGKSKESLLNVRGLDPLYDNTVLWIYYANNKAIDLSKNNLQLTPNPLTAIGTTLVNKNIFFTGNIIAPDHPSFEIGTKDFCLEFYSFFTGTGGEWRYVQTKFGSPWTNTPNFGAQNFDNFGIVREGIAWDNQQAGISTTGWHHYALTRQGSTLRFFRNGVLISTSSNSINYNGARDGIGWYFTRTTGNQALRLTIGNSRYSANFSMGTVKLFPFTFDNYSKAQQLKTERKQDSLSYLSPLGLKYNPTVPIEHLYKRPVYSYGASGATITNIPDWNVSYQKPKARVSYVYSNTPPYVDGLIGYRYVGYFNDNVTWFDTASFHGDTNILTSINNFTNSADYYSWMWLGYFKATVSGSWTFFTASDDASYIWVGSNAVSGYTTSNALVNNGGQHGVQERSGSIILEADTYYPIRIMFGEAGGGDQMTVSFTPSNGTKTTNGLGYYYNLKVFEL